MTAHQRADEAAAVRLLREDVHIHATPQAVFARLRAPEVGGWFEALRGASGDGAAIRSSFPRESGHKKNPPSGSTAGCQFLSMIKRSGRVHGRESTAMNCGMGMRRWVDGRDFSPDRLTASVS